MKSIAAIIVTHNSAAEIGACIDALQDCSSVLVVDNSSQDGTLSAVADRPWVRSIANRRNRGFAAAVNQGVMATYEPLLLVVNPDAVVVKGLDLLAAACEEHGVAGGKLAGDDGRAQAGFTIRRLPKALALAFEVLGLNRLFPWNPVNRKYRYSDRDLEQSGPAEQPAGAFLMVRRDVFEGLDGLDEEFYPVWFEDVDFARRLKDRGYVPWYAAEAEARHKGAHAIKTMSGKYRRLIWYASLLRYAAKHFETSEFRLVCGSVVAGCALRLMFGVFGDLQAVSAYRRVIRVGWASLWSGLFRSEDFKFDEWSGLEKRAEAHAASRLR